MIIWVGGFKFQSSSKSDPRPRAQPDLDQAIFHPNHRVQSPVYHSSKYSHQSSPPPRPEFRQSVIHRPGSRVDGPLQAQPESSSESGPSKSSIRNHRISSSPVTVYYFCSVSRAQYLSFEFSFLELGRVGQGPVLELSTAAFRHLLYTCRGHGHSKCVQ